MDRFWKPSVTVAAVIEKSGKFLMVQEKTKDGIKFNQPAGHLDQGESLIDAVSRETMEETAHEFKPTFLVGIYHNHFKSAATSDEVSYIRFTFSGQIGKKYNLKLDKEIIRSIWMSYEEIIETKDSHRTPLVLLSIKDYLMKRNYPLSLIYTDPSVIMNKNV
mgnify:CR=1 FL=1|tara:strand:- start:66 stop:551 length:486 start_codon:yes stop_codon:yes gene_type:complete